MHELSELSDIELADIGVTRSGIPSVAWRVSRGDPASPTSAPALSTIVDDRTAR
jgi:hypothetical protein